MKLAYSIPVLDKETRQRLENETSRDPAKFQALLNQIAIWRAFRRMKLNGNFSNPTGAEADDQDNVGVVEY